MYNPSSKEVVFFLVLCSILVLLLILVITVILFRYQKKQHDYFKNLEELKVKFENELLKSQLEIQEQTFQNISREIHDNINQKLTLAKLFLNTIPESAGPNGQIINAAQIIGESILDLGDISRSMSSELIMNNGLVKALEFEVMQLNKTGLFQISLSVVGEPVFLDTQKELLLFRIVQESLNNIVKHANATAIKMVMHYTNDSFSLSIDDNGKGFNEKEYRKEGSGLCHIRKRAQMLNGACTISTQTGIGTSIKIDIPLNVTNAIPGIISR